MRDVRDYARSQGVAIKGDIPIWNIAHECRCMDRCSSVLIWTVKPGAPPDDFAVLGQIGIPDI